MASSRKRTKRESFLTHRSYSNNFLVAYGKCEKEYGIFFGISRKFAKAVKRNKVKRIFRESAKQILEPVLKQKGINNFSICLISKKGTKFSENTVNSELRNEIEILLKKAIEKI